LSFFLDGNYGTKMKPGGDCIIYQLTTNLCP
jgi:hypothetical protein